MSDFDRIAVVGTSGTGNSSLACELAEIQGGAHVELDALYWGPDWSEADDDTFRARVSDALQGERWACDGNYGQVRELVWERATAIVWLDYPFRTVLWRIVTRTIRRVRSGEELWGTGNRESFWRSLSRDSVIWYALRTWRERRERYERLFHAPEWQAVHKLRVRRPRDADLLLRALRRAAEMRDAA